MQRCDFLKDIKRIIKMIILGLFTVIFVYPFIHELGHALFCTLFGGSVVSFSVLPLPYIVCDMTDVGGFGIVLSALGGLMLTCAVVFTIKPKKFLMLFISFTYTIVTMFEVLLAVISAVLFLCGGAVLDQDMKYVMINRHVEPIIVICFLISLFVFLCIKVFCLHPVKALYLYFELE